MWVNRWHAISIKFTVFGVFRGQFFDLSSPIGGDSKNYLWSSEWIADTWGNLSSPLSLTEEASTVFSATWGNSPSSGEASLVREGTTLITTEATDGMLGEVWSLLVGNSLAEGKSTTTFGTVTLACTGATVVVLLAGAVLLLGKLPVKSA